MCLLWCSLGYNPILRLTSTNLQSRYIAIWSYGQGCILSQVSHYEYPAVSISSWVSHLALDVSSWVSLCPEYLVVSISFIDLLDHWILHRHMVCYAHRLLRSRALILWLLFSLFVSVYLIPWHILPHLLFSWVIGPLLWGYQEFTCRSIELWGATAFASYWIDSYWMSLHCRCIGLAFTVLLYHVPLNGNIDSTSVPLFLTIQTWGRSFCAPYVVSPLYVHLDSMWCCWMYYSSILCETHDGVSLYSLSYQGCLGCYPCHSTWCLPSSFRISALSKIAHFVSAWYIAAELAIAMVFLIVLVMAANLMSLQSARPLLPSSSRLLPLHPRIWSPRHWRMIVGAQLTASVMASKRRVTCLGTFFGGLAHGSCCETRIKALLATCILVEAFITALARRLNRYGARHWQALGCRIETSLPWHWILGSLLISFSRYCSRILFFTSSLKYVGSYFCLRRFNLCSRLYDNQNLWLHLCGYQNLCSHLCGYQNLFSHLCDYYNICLICSNVWHSIPVGAFNLGSLVMVSDTCLGSSYRVFCYSQPCVFCMGPPYFWLSHQFCLVVTLTSLALGTRTRITTSMCDLSIHISFDLSIVSFYVLI